MPDIKSKIRESAFQFFLRYGYKKTSVDEIAEDAGIGKGTIYNYFKNKEELFVETTTWWREQQYQTIEHEIESYRDADEKIIMRLLLEVKNFRGCIREFGMTNKVISELIMVKQSSDDLHDYDINILEQYLSEGYAQGIFAKQDFHAIAITLNRVMMQFIQRWIIELSEKEAEKEIKELIGLILIAVKQH
jgi:AcrR family transcriptional regulator